MSDPQLSPQRPTQPEDWAGEMGARWLANIDRFESMIAPAGAALLAHANYATGERVVDIGCGGGATSLAITSAVGPTGSVVGVDISPDLIAKAKDRAEVTGTSNTHFQCVDAAAYRLEAPFDRLFSRFGSMFFPDPVAAFSNLHRCLRPGGRIDLAVWGPPRENPWMMEMIGVLRRHVDVPPAVPRAPGPFAFENVRYMKDVLASAGFRDTDVLAYSGLQPIGGQGASPEEAVRFAMSSLAVGRLAERQPQDLVQEIEQDLRDVFVRHYRPSLGVLMSGKVWLVTAMR